MRTRHSVGEGRQKTGESGCKNRRRKVDTPVVVVVDNDDAPCIITHTSKTATRKSTSREGSTGRWGVSDGHLLYLL